jgi:pulcherriminic acid synthase
VRRYRKDLDVERAFTGGANHTAFALGRHFCVGAILAKMELQIATNLLLDAMDDIRFAEAPREVGIFTRAPKRLKLRFSPAA